MASAMLLSGAAAPRVAPRAAKNPRVARRAVAVRAAAVAAEDVPTPEKRSIMNLLLAGAIGLPVAGLAGPFALFFVPPK
jgi:hypothetical protein